jgi:hypothetical protein
MERFNIRVEELIRSQFNARVLLTDITHHNYLHLLASRNYFNLIYIEGQILKRFENFKSRTASQYPALKAVLTLEHFIILDDYVRRGLCRSSVSLCLGV